MPNNAAKLFVALPPPPIPLPSPVVAPAVFPPLSGPLPLLVVALEGSKIFDNIRGGGGAGAAWTRRVG